MGGRDAGGQRAGWPTACRRGGPGGLEDSQAARRPGRRGGAVLGGGAAGEVPGGLVAGFICDEFVIRICVFDLCVM
ncbi:hypothetical protein [Oryza sativa Japonica Group]|uniref:Uncharacterized protein n=1 Tax=Oryza sativa subsp. japonica TaxID=39947 RepID=Q8RV52_ORYSJ|nr:hypothetical protein [Oryza sativa Japonica Group]BAB90700.1 hypothetical protein [Oryza sativa Japonica Group]